MNATIDVPLVKSAAADSALLSQRIGELREQGHLQLQELLSQFSAILNNPSERWAPLFLRELKNLDDKEAGSLVDPLRRFLDKYVPLARDVLQNTNTSSIDSGENRAVESALTFIHDLGHRLFEMQSTRIKLSPQIHFVSFEDIATRRPDLVLVTDDDITIYGHTFPRPQSEELYHKGGFPRVLLKVYADAPWGTFLTELPPNDLDVVVRQGSYDAEQEALRIGVTTDGIEFFDEIDISKILTTRDVDINCCLVGKHGLYFADWAEEAARRGMVNLLPASRGLYGNDFFIDEEDGLILAKSRGVSRLMKTVVEGKAESFDFVPRNSQIGLGIYWLVLARKFAAKENGEQLLGRFFELGQKMGITEPGANTIYEQLNAVHERYPFFSFDSTPLSDTGVVRWLSGKLSKQILRMYRAEYPIEREKTIGRSENDHFPNPVGLPPFFKMPSSPDFAARWQQFTEECNQRSLKVRLSAVTDEAK